MQAQVATNSRVTALADVLQRAFRDDPVMRWILPADIDYDRAALPLFSHILSKTTDSQSCFTDSEERGVSLWESPGHRLSLPSQLNTFLKLAWLLKGNISRASKIQAVMENYKPRRPFWHLTYLATDPDFQGQGIGRRLLSPITENLPASGVDKTPVYLECSNKDSISFYLSQGFNLIEEVKIPDGPTIWPMSYSYRSQNNVLKQ